MIERNITDCRILPTDYLDYGGEIKRWKNDEDFYPDCSCGCRWFAPLWNEETLNKQDSDYGVCMNQKAPRHGLLTFEHMVGYGCYEQKPDE